MRVFLSPLFPLLALAAACATSPTAEGLGEGGGTATSSITKAAPVGEPEPTRDPAKARIKVFALSDFHGHLYPLEPANYGKYFGGIAHIGGTMKARDHFHAKNSLLVDNGDMWTGPSVSTFLRGEPVIAAYNALGVSAANVANHEFDFGLDVLRSRAKEAKFPFLGANIVDTATGKGAEFVRPYIIEERDGVKVGIIGLSYRETPKTTLAKHVAGLEFKDYGDTLLRVVPEVKAAGAEIIVVLFHDTMDEAQALFEKHPELAVHAVIAGQNHRKGAVMVGSIPILNPGPFGRSYGRFDIEVDRQTRAVSISHEIVDVTGPIGAPSFPPLLALEAIGEGARQRAKEQEQTVLGRLKSPLPLGNFEESPLGHLVVDSWLAAFPEVDVAICNHGALREPLGRGGVTLGHITSVLPFENNLYVVKLTGKQLKAQLLIDSPVVSGITWRFQEKDGKRQVLSVSDRLGKPIDDKKTYRVVINDFMYDGGDGFTFKEADPSPSDTGISLREPVMRTFRLAEGAGREVDAPVGPRAAKMRR